MPTRVAFEDTSDLHYPYVFVDNIIELLFFLDFLMNFFSAKYDYEENLKSFQQKASQITKKYLKKWFFLDLLSLLPISTVVYAVHATNFNLVYFLVSIIKLSRIRLFIHEFKVILKNAKLHFYIIDMLTKMIFFVYSIHLSSNLFSMIIILTDN